MRHLIICGIIAISCLSCQDDFDCNSPYLTQPYESYMISPAELELALIQTNGPYTDISYTFSSHCFEEIEDLSKWLSYPMGNEPRIRKVKGLWYLDGVQVFVPSDTATLRRKYNDLIYDGHFNDCNLEKWPLRDLHDYSKYPTLYLDTIKAIAYNNRLSSGSVGIGGKEPAQFRRRYWLINRLNTEELLSLLDFPNPVVKAVAFEGLYRHKYPNLFQILLHFLSLEQAYIGYSSGCIGWRLHLSQYCFSYIMRYYPGNAPPPPPHIYDHDALTKGERAIIIQELEKYGPYW